MRRFYTLAIAAAIGFTPLLASDAFASCSFGLLSQSYPAGYSNCFGNPSFAVDGVIPGQRLRCLASGQWDDRGACYVGASQFYRRADR